MKLIKAPEKSIVVKHPTSNDEKKVEKEISFTEFVTTCIDNYVEIKTPKQWRQAQKVVAAVEAMNGTLQLEDAEYELLKAAVEKGGSYAPFAGRQLVDFAEAVENAE
jgi:hypothetical protein